MYANNALYIIYNRQAIFSIRNIYVYNVIVHRAIQRVRKKFNVLHTHIYIHYVEMLRRYFPLLVPYKKDCTRRNENI